MSSKSVKSSIEVQCECGYYVPVEFKKQLGYFNGMCPNKDCQIWNRMRVTEIKTQQNYFESNATDPKTCPNCGKIWIKSHTCKGGNRLAQQKAIIEAMN